MSAVPPAALRALTSAFRSTRSRMASKLEREAAIRESYHWGLGIGIRALIQQQTQNRHRVSHNRSLIHRGAPIDGFGVDIGAMLQQ